MDAQSIGNTFYKRTQGMYTAGQRRPCIHEFRRFLHGDAVHQIESLGRSGVEPSPGAFMFEGMSTEIRRPANAGMDADYRNIGVVFHMTALNVCAIKPLLGRGEPSLIGRQPAPHLTANFATYRPA